MAFKQSAVPNSIWPQFCMADSHKIQPAQEPAMRNANRTVGELLHGIKTAIARDQVRMEPYTVVADGAKFGIALRDKVVIHGMQRQRALEIAAILNSAQESEPDEYGSPNPPSGRNDALTGSVRNKRGR